MIEQNDQKAIFNFDCEPTTIISEVTASGIFDKENEFQMKYGQDHCDYFYNNKEIIE